MALSDDLQRAAGTARAFAEAGEELTGVVACEPRPGDRIYVCAFGSDGRRSWIALDDEGRPVEQRAAVRDAVSISALCEVAVETAGGGDLEELRSQLVAVRLREDRPGIEEAEEAALELERTLGTIPRLATPGYLDDVGTATRRLERALGQDGAPFAQAMQQATAAVQAMLGEVEANYKRPLV